MEAARSGPLPFLYEAGAEAGLVRDVLNVRCAALFVGLVVGNLADDLADGDCNYITPLTAGPGTQYLLSAWFFSLLLECGIPPSLVMQVGRELVQSAALQNTEVRTVEWDVATYRAVGEGIAARQWSAYLSALWHDTPLQPRAVELGWHLGIAGHVAQDLSSDSRRLHGLGDGGLREIVAWADASLTLLAAAKLRFLDAAGAWMRERIHPEPAK